MLTVLRSKILSDVRTRANLQNSQFVSDAEIARLIDLSAQGLYDLLILARGQEYFLTTFSSVTVAGQTVYPLPADFYELLKVRLRIGGIWRTLRDFDRHDVDSLENAQTYGSRYDPMYRLNGLQAVGIVAGVDQVEIRPAPPTAWTMEIDYLPVLNTTPVSGDVAYPSVNGWEQMVIWDVTATLKDMGEEDPTFALSQKAAIEERIRELAGARDAGSPSRMVDTRRDIDGGGDPFLRQRWT